MWHLRSKYEPLPQQKFSTLSNVLQNIKQNEVRFQLKTAWQSCVETENYSIVSFNHITVLEAP